MKAGDALVFTDAIAHGSARRVNEGFRRICVLRYMPSWANFRMPYEPTRELLGRLTPARRQVRTPLISFDLRYGWLGLLDRLLVIAGRGAALGGQVSTGAPAQGAGGAGAGGGGGGQPGAAERPHSRLGLSSEDRCKLKIPGLRIYTSYLLWVGDATTQQKMVCFRAVHKHTRRPRTHPLAAPSQTRLVGRTEISQLRRAGGQQRRKPIRVRSSETQKLKGIDDEMLKSSRKVPTSSRPSPRPQAPSCSGRCECHRRYRPRPPAPAARPRSEARRRCKPARSPGASE